MWSGCHNGMKYEDMTDPDIVPQGIHTDCLILEYKFLIQQNYFRAGRECWAFDKTVLIPD